MVEEGIEEYGMDGREGIWRIVYLYGCYRGYHNIPSFRSYYPSNNTLKIRLL